MIEIGTDLVLVSRMEKSLQIPGFAERVFSQPERAYCKTTESFAGIFAAKEAYYKALGTGLQLPLMPLPCCTMIGASRILTASRKQN